MQPPDNGPSLDPDGPVDNCTFAVVATGRLLAEDIEFVRQEIARALRRLDWDDVAFEVEVLS